MDIDTLRDHFHYFNDLNILIIGDVMIDSYLWGTADRISPEAPVPVVSVKKRQQRLGGAANVALNIQSMGANPILCSIIGKDPKSEEFLRLMNENALPTEGILKSNNRITTVKYRIIANNYHMLRVDEETEDNLSKEDQLTFINNINKIINSNKIDCIIFEDYDKGLLNKDNIMAIIDLANINNIPTIVDPKRKNFNYYKNTTLFKPNLKEIKEGLKLEHLDTELGSLLYASDLLQKNLNNKLTLITLSEKGVFIINNESGYYKHIPAHIRDISDVSGAGDTVISVAALCLCSNMNENMIACISNLAGGIVCEHVGVVPINKTKLLSESEKFILNQNSSIEQ